MTAIIHTTYPRFKCTPTRHELEARYTPAKAELAFVITIPADPCHRLHLLLWLKRFRRLGYFPLWLRSHVGLSSTCVPPLLQASFIPLQPIRELGEIRCNKPPRLLECAGSKRRVKPGLGFAWYRIAWVTLGGYEEMNQLRKGQVEGTSKGDIVGQVRFIDRAFGLAA